MKVSFNRPEVLDGKSSFRNFAKFTRKHLCQSLFLIKVPQPVTLLKKRLWHRCFFVNFATFLKTKHLSSQNFRWLLLFRIKLAIEFHVIFRTTPVTESAVFKAIDY